MKFRPISDRVLIEPDVPLDKTKGGIIIPDMAQDRPIKGKILAVGRGKKDEPMTVVVGDNVLYGRQSGSMVTLEDKEYLIMRESDIFAVI